MTLTELLKELLITKKDSIKRFEFNNLEDERCKKPCIFRRIDYYPSFFFTNIVFAEEPFNYAEAHHQCMKKADDDFI